MKYLKMLGLAAVAAMALMAFLGAGTASATTLCTTPEEHCAAGWHYPAGTVIKASLEEKTTATLKTTGNLLENTCTTSEVEGSSSTGGGSATETVFGPVTKLTFGGCTNTTDVLELGELEIHAIAGSLNGTLTGKGFKVTMNLSGISCTYTAGTGTDLGTLTSGSMATMDVNAVVTKSAGGFTCPSNAVWEAKYTVTNPEPLYISTG